MTATVDQLLSAMHTLENQQPRNREYVFFMSRDQVNNITAIGRLFALVDDLRRRRRVGTIKHKHSRRKAITRLAHEHHHRMFAAVLARVEIENPMASPLMGVEVQETELTYD